ncbi:Gfo/Idh/MocA family protein [Lacimicrobium alkaliphilum]|uniref:Oxidoreductase n=1 Tax=Lacimicrobium alkaliphilum TaxID=1526571 RepID=A0ABQ1RU42_9ALTE|nr:Gfo/Idh/MocA family oxidoreductase [Lacimicrobium alkaliphilum]GGD78906.1 oxidoreductase [Lacimicrobium alkaliphilum]
MKKVRMGMVGGGPGAFIGGVHRMAANLDGKIELVCGAFSRDAEKSRLMSQELNLCPSRCYDSYQQLFEQEASLPADQRMEFVSIVTPNHLHFEIARLALESGFHVLCDKPATLTLDEARELAVVQKRSGRLYALTHTYTGYPMVVAARELVARGELGAIRKVAVEYHQGWLADTNAESGKQAAWRLNPEQAGISCCMADIGVHAANLAEFICNDGIDQLSADLNASHNRQLDDDGVVMLRFASGARGMLSASQIAVGEENNLRIRVYGEKASIDWSQEQPNSLKLMHADKPFEVLRSATDAAAELGGITRTPPGHPEGYLEAFANLYQQFAEQVAALRQQSTSGNNPLPGINEALRGMAFIETVVAASASEQKWHTMPDLTNIPNTGDSL